MKRININDYSNEELQVKKIEKMKSGKKRIDYRWKKMSHTAKKNQY